MEPQSQLRPHTRGLTHLKTVQIVSDPAEPYVIESIDTYVPCGMTKRITGIALESDAKVLSALQETLLPPRQMRIFSLFLEGADLQPAPNSLEKLHQKKVISLDSNTCKFLREFVQETFDYPSNRRQFEEAIANRPSFIDHLWDHDDFRHVRAIYWRGTLILKNSVFFRNVRLITIRDPEVLCHVQCVQDTKVSIENVTFTHRM